MDRREQEKVTGYFKEKAEALGHQIEAAYGEEGITIQGCMEGKTVSIGLKNPGAWAECILRGTEEEKKLADGQLKSILDSALGAQGIARVLCDGKYEDVKDRLVIRPFRHKTVQKEIKNTPHVLVGGIALVLYIEMAHQKENYYSAKIQHRQLEEWGIRQEDALRYAMRNTARLHGPRLYTVENLLSWNMEDQNNGNFMEAGWEINKKSRGHILTNTLEINGAVAAFYPGVADRIADGLENDFLIAFTSIHEAQVHSVAMISPDIVQSSLRNTNLHCNRKEEILTDSVFRYGRQTRKFSRLAGDGFREENFRISTSDGWVEFEW